MFAGWTTAETAMFVATSGSLASAVHGIAVAVFSSVLATLRTPTALVEGMAFVMAGLDCGTSSVQTR